MTATDIDAMMKDMDSVSKQEPESRVTSAAISSVRSTDLDEYYAAM